MSYFFSQSLSQVKNITGKKYTKFQIVKGHDGHINQIKGTTTNGDLYHIEHDIKDRNNKTGMIHSQHKVYKIKSSDLKNILKESEKKPKSTIKVISLKETPKKKSSLKTAQVVKVAEPKKVKKSTSTLKKKSEKSAKKEKKVKKDKKEKKDKKAKKVKKTKIDKKPVLKKLTHNNEK